MPRLSAGEIAAIRATVPGTLLAMTCTFSRPTAGAEDGYGNPTETWADYLPDTPCWWQERANDENEIVGPNIEAVVTRQRLVLPAGTAVRTSDRVKSVIGVDGVQIAGPHDIREVIIKVAETVLILREIA
ncbi:MAG: hypothetical protein ACSLE9_08025 [Burkholderiaceae bacterium]